MAYTSIINGTVQEGDWYHTLPFYCFFWIMKCQSLLIPLVRFADKKTPSPPMIMRLTQTFLPGPQTTSWWCQYICFCFPGGELSQSVCCSCINGGMQNDIILVSHFIVNLLQIVFCLIRTIFPRLPGNMAMAFQDLLSANETERALSFASRMNFSFSLTPSRFAFTLCWGQRIK